jgi:phosphoribosylaminoimidazole-succinocarboxamide synthase
MPSNPVEKTNIKGLNLLSRGKVRDIYDLGDTLLIVATDRLSAFDYVLSTPIPGKGKVLTKLSAFWFDFVSPMVEHHMITTSPDEFPTELRPHAEILDGRSMLCRKAEILPVECIVRGYISGSAWKEYRDTGMVCGERLPVGFVESEQFAPPIFTPSTKAAQGTHDQNISYPQFASILGDDLALEVRTLSLEIFKLAAAYALKKGIIIADTKFEWGLIGGELVLADEIFTPDSSRLWPAASYSKGKSQPSFDKQFVRDYLTAFGWDKNSTPPPLPPDVVKKTAEKYNEACRLITGCDVKI